MGFSDEMKKMCEEMGTARSERADEMEKLHSEFSHDRTQRRQGVNRLFKDVHVLVQHFHTDRGQMAKEMRKMLEEFREGLRKEVAQMMSSIRKEISGIAEQSQRIRKEARAMIREYRADFKKAHQIYQEFAHKSQKSRQPSSFSKPASLRASSQQGRIMAAIKESPSGMTRKELAYAMGMQEQALGRSLTRMQKGGMIHKKKNLYSAA